ncbi:MAG TPA: winged helix-turn-helix domain-containing protein [Actinoplanes sp.]|nr:winged helix-turn-helix domain-containing protein [Actinoplanes sp.]
MISCRGELQPGDQLPSESYLQQTYGVSRVKARAAIRSLRERGLVVTLPQRGTYVTDLDYPGSQDQKP